MRAIVRQLQDPAVRFVAVSIALYSGVLWLIVSTVDRTLLNTPAAIAIVTTIVIHTAGAGPIIRERTGSFSRAALLAVGTPLTLFAMGAAAAIVIERSDLAPAVQSALLTPWWFLYPTLAFWATREKWRAAGEGDRELGARVGRGDGPHTPGGRFRHSGVRPSAELLQGRRLTARPYRSTGMTRQGQAGLQTSANPAPLESGLDSVRCWL